MNKDLKKYEGYTIYFGFSKSEFGGIFEVFDPSFVSVNGIAQEVTEAISKRFPEFNIEMVSIYDNESVNLFEDVEDRNGTLIDTPDDLLRIMGEIILGEIIPNVVSNYK